MKRSIHSAQPTLKKLQDLAACLERISDHFVWEQFMARFRPEVSHTSLTFSEEDEENAPEKNNKKGDEEEDTEEYDEDLPIETFDREEVEVAIDVFLTHLLKLGIIQKKKKGNLPSFSGVFESIFGEKHPATGLALSFEDHITGYFGWIDYENMKAAYGELMKIRDLVAKAIEKQRV